MGNGLSKVTIYFERIAIVTKAGPKFCIQHSKKISSAGEMCSDPPPRIPHSHVQTFLKKMRVGTSNSVKLCRVCILNSSLAYSHAAAIKNCDKKEISFPFCPHLDKDSALGNGETYCEFLNQRHKFSHKKY